MLTDALGLRSMVLGWLTRASAAEAVSGKCGTYRSAISAAPPQNDHLAAPLVQNRFALLRRRSRSITLRRRGSKTIAQGFSEPLKSSEGLQL
jgi:hypothetical protein